MRCGKRAHCMPNKIAARGRGAVHVFRCGGMFNSGVVHRLWCRPAPVSSTVSNGLASQTAQAQFGSQWVLCRTMLLRMTSIFPIQATSATFFSLPRPSSRS
jgi:hypothetical protein